jgi:hypothetical protein
MEGPTSFPIGCSFFIDESFEVDGEVKRNVSTSERVVLPLSLGEWIIVTPQSAGSMLLIVEIPRTFAAQIL